MQNPPIPKDLTELTQQPFWEGLSSSAQRALLRKSAPARSLESLTLAPLPEPVPTSPMVSTPTAPGIPVNIRVNDPSEDVGFGNQTTQSEPSLAVRGAFAVVGYNDSTPVASLSGFSNSSKAGQTFQDNGGLTGQSSGDAVLVVNRTGTFYYATLADDARGQSMIGVAKSTDNGQTFGAAVNATGPANGPSFFQDKEWLAVDNTGGPNDGNLYLAWTRFSTAQAQIMFTRSIDGGTTWSAPIALSTLGPGLGHQGAMPAVAPNGQVYVTWLDRATSQILVVRSDDGGQTFSNPVTGGGAVQTITQIPSTLNGNIRANSFPSIAVDPTTGTVYITYAQRDGNDKANVYLVRSTDHGQHWSTPVRVNDDATITDQWMPSVAVASNGVVGVMFYDRRNDPTPNLNIDVYLALSTNGGISFLPNQRITTTNFPPAVNFDPGIATNYMGDYNHMVAVGTRFYMAWGDNRDVIGTRHDPNVYFAVYGTEDNYVRDNPVDDGTVPSTPGQAWQSPDIQPDMNPSIFGTPNPVHVVVHNRGAHDATNVTVRLYWTDPATNIPVAAWRPDRITVETSPGVFTPTNQQVIPLIPAGGSAQPPQPFIWDPPQPNWATEVGHFCLLTQIESPGDPLTFTAGGWESVERDNNLAVRNVHVQPVVGGRPTKIVFFVVGDLEREWISDLVIDPRRLPQGLQLMLTLPAEILQQAKFENIKVVERNDKTMTLAVAPGGVAQIMGMQLQPKGRYEADLLVEVPKDFGLKEAPFTITQIVDKSTVGGLMYLLRPMDGGKKPLPIP